MRKGHSVLFGKLEGKGLLGKPTCAWKYDIETDLK
jgi:hypothetical protein